MDDDFYRFHEFQKLKGQYSQQFSKRIFEKELKKGRPLEYILQEAYFYNSWFYVDERVLIPRFESEGLVELVLKNFKGSSLCEVGVGSGALMLALLKEFDHPVKFTGIDIDAGAIEVCRRNYELHKYAHPKETEVEILQGDRLEPVEGRQFDLIYSNPPYIKKSQGVHPMVEKYEPDVALFLGDDVYEQWYKEFFQIASQITRVLILEGHEENLCELKTLASSSGFKRVIITKDLTARARFLVASV